MIERRHFLAALPALAMAPRLWAQSPAPALRVRGLSQLTLTVSDLARSLKFYQDLLGLPVQARQPGMALLRVGAGPQFVALKQAATGEAPSISAFGMGVEGFSVERAQQVVTQLGATATRSGPTLFVTDPSGVVFQLHDVSYCGGSGALGNVCNAVEASPSKGLFATRDLSHFTIRVTDQAKTVAFLRDLVGMPVQAMQAAAPAYGIGPGVHFLMFIPSGPGRGGAGTPAPTSRIDHACLSIDGFKPDAVTKALVGFGMTSRPAASRDPLVTYISLRMPDRGGAEGGTPELYFTDPDGLPIQLQDPAYCGGGGFLGEVCPAP